MLALVAITPRQDAYYAFLGKSPAFGYMMVGCALLATSRGRARSIFLSGLCFSFALLTKHIALFCALGASGSWFLRDLYLYRFYTIRRMGVFLAGVAGPLAAFELVKVIVLGSPGFMAHWHGYLELLSTLHVAPQDRLSEFLAVINRPYLVSVEAALFALGSLLFTIVITFRRYWLKDDPIFGFMLFAGAIAHLMYILFLSSITARYLWIGMAVMVFAAMSPVLYLRLRFAVPLAVAVIAFVATPTAVLYSYRLQLAGTDGRLQFEREIVMREIAKHPDLPIVSQWWGSIYDVIYLLKDNHPWYITNDEAKVPNLRGLFVTYEPFSPKSYPFYDLVHRSCERLHAELTYYKIFICESNRPASTSPPTRLE